MPDTRLCGILYTLTSQDNCNVSSLLYSLWQVPMIVCGAVLLDGGHKGFELHDDQLGAITGRYIVHLEHYC